MTTVLSTGFKELNALLHLDNGFRRGQFVFLPHLEPHLGSLMCRTLMRHFTIYNQPAILNPEHKPALVHISFLHNEKELKRRLDLDIASHRQAQWDSVLDKGDFHHLFVSISKSKIELKDILNPIEHMVKAGYDIHAVLCEDTRNLILHKGLDMWQEQRFFYRELQQYFSSKDITFITPYELSDEAIVMRKHMDIADWLTAMSRGDYYVYPGVKIFADVELYMATTLIKTDRFHTFNYLHMRIGKYRGRLSPNMVQYFTIPWKTISA